MEYGEALRQTQQRQLEQALAQSQQWRETGGPCGGPPPHTPKARG